MAAVQSYFSLRNPRFLTFFPFLCFALHTAYAGSATWNLRPQNDIWNNPVNWTPAVVPNGPSDIATFAQTHLPQAETRVNTEVGSIIFEGTDPSFEVLTEPGITLTISGAGVSNNTGLSRTFLSVLQSVIKLTGSATIDGSQTIFQNNGTPTAGDPGGVTEFDDTASANAATFMNFGSFADGGAGGGAQFNGNSTAAFATFSNLGTARSDATGGFTQFNGASTAAAASITNDGGTGDGEETGGLTEFFDTASAGTCSIINQPSGSIHDLIFPGPGSTNFHGSSTAGSATITTNAGDPLSTFSGTAQFFDSSSADHATFNDSGEITFYNTSTAANGAFTLTPGAMRGVVNFYDTSTAADATFTLLDGAVAFNEDSTAANSTVIRAQPSQVGSLVIFRDSATADHANVTANGNTEPGEGENDLVEFDDTSTAANANITLNPGIGSGSFGALGFFGDQATAGDSTITVNGAVAPGDTAAALLQFYFRSTAGSATLIARGGANGGSGGEILFSRDARGGTARIEIFGNSKLVLDERRHAASLSIGSLEGNGLVILGGQQLQVGYNDLSTDFSGTIQDTEAGPLAGGSLVKTGRGTFIFSGINSYTGGTTLNGGILLVKNGSGSATGTGLVQVTKGTLGGDGIIGGPVAVGTGSGSGAFLSPSAGSKMVASLTLTQSLTFNTGSTYALGVSTTAGQSDTTTANGVSIASGALFSLREFSHHVLPSGTVLIAINNTSTTAITGTFANLPDGATISVGSNSYQANYEGGDGNDLVLTVVAP